MAIPATHHWFTRTGASDTLNGGGFDFGSAGFATDGTIDVNTANTSAPVVGSASYSFVAGDVGYKWFGKLGTNLTPGEYTIASVAGGKATLDASIGSATLYVGGALAGPNTAVGCGTTSSALSGLTWGVDYSQNTAARFAYTDLAAGGAGSTLSSTANPFGKNSVGNTLITTGGANLTIGTFVILSVSGASATFDRAITTGAVASNGTGGFGGSLTTLGKMTSLAVGSNQMFWQGGAYSQSANPTINPGSVTPANGVPYTTITGYVTIPGDATRANRASWPVLTMTTGCSTGIPITTNGWILQNFVIDANGATDTTANTACITHSGQYSLTRSLWLKNFKQYGINASGTYHSIEGNEVSGGLSGMTAAINATAQVHIRANEVHGNVGPGIIANTGSTVSNNLVYANTGASSDGISTQYNTSVCGNVCDGNGRDGIRIAYIIAQQIHNNVLTNNGAYGLNYSAGDFGRGDVSWDNNAYYNNTSGTRHFVGTGVTDAILTGDPYTNKAGGDFSLNNTAGAGAACRAAGIPGVYPSGTTTAYPDIGVQHLDAGGGAGGVTRLVNGGLVAA